MITDEVYFIAKKFSDGKTSIDYLYFTSYEKALGRKAFIEDVNTTRGKPVCEIITLEREGLT